MTDIVPAADPLAVNPLAVGPPASGRAPAVALRRLTLDDLRTALRRGWADYLDKRGELIFLGLIYPIVGLFACLTVFERDLIPLLFPLAAGFSLMAAPLASGFYELARRRESGDDPRWIRAFDLFAGPRFWPIAALAAFVAALFFAWIGCAWAIYSVTLGALPAATGEDFLRRLFTTPQGWEMMIVGDLVGFAFAVVGLAVSAISFPMLVGGGVGPLTAAETSVRAVLANPGVFAAWGLIVAALLALGSIPLFVGLAVVLPVLGYATWHLYRRAVEG